MKTDIVIYIHGKGGNARGAEFYKKIFTDKEVFGFDYKSNLPWDAKKEFNSMINEFAQKYNNIILVAESIGAYFALIADIDKFISKAFFISPIANMEALILEMIKWAGTTESELEIKKVIPVDFGEELSWEYLQYVRKEKIKWNVPTYILFGSLDNLQSLETIEQFAKNVGAKITTMEGGEHWFHTETQMKFLEKWLLKNI